MPIISIIAGEFFIYNNEILLGLAVHIVNLLAIILLIIFGELSLETKNVMQSLTLLPLLRVVNFSIPQVKVTDLSMPQLQTIDPSILQFFVDIHIRYILIYGVILMPIYSIIKNQHITFKDLKMSGRFYTHLPIIILIGTVLIMVIQYIGFSGIYTIHRDILPIGGEFATVFLIISLSISLLISGTKYWNKYNSNVIGTCTNPILVVFAGIAISNIILIIYA